MMTKTKLNPEFFRRHLAVCVLMAGVSCWFGYDAAVTYPQASAAALYESIEKSPPPAGFDVEGFKRQKVRRQWEFAALSGLAAVLIGLHLVSVACFRFEYDESGFVWNGKRHPLTDVKSVDRARWPGKGILVLNLESERIVLDAWHHLGVREFEKMV